MIGRRKRQAAVPRQPAIHGLGLVMTVTAVLWLGLFGTQDEIRLEISDIEIDETGEVELVGAVYRGQTAGGEAYEITASQASETRSGAFDLSSPTAELTRRDGDIVNLQSQTGVYSPDSGDIDLAGDVVKAGYGAGHDSHQPAPVDDAQTCSR